MKKIKLTNGGVVKVDDADYDYLSKFSWRSKKSHGGTQSHAVRDVTLGKKKVTVRMHRLITESDVNEHVFHVNGNGLDNRRSNLQKRVKNAWTGRADSSGYLGVDKKGRWYHSEIEFTGRTYELGRFSSAEDAARAYDDAARGLYGQHARVNFT